MVCLDWFVAASSDEAGRKSEGTTDVLLILTPKLGMAAIPAKSKGAENHPHLVDMAEKILHRMRHEKVKLRSDGEPTIKSLVQKIKDRWSQKHTTVVEETPLYTVQPAMDVPSVQSKLCDD